MSKILSLVFLVAFLEQVIGNLNVWVTPKMMTDILVNLELSSNSSKRNCDKEERIELPDRVPVKYRLIDNGKPIQYVYWKIGDSVIPPDIKQVCVMWNSSTKHTYVLQARSLNLTLMHPPMLNIPAEGIVPNTPSEVTLSLPCTGRATGEAPVHIRFEITEVLPAGKRLKKETPVSINTTVKKRCLSRRDLRRQNKFRQKCSCKRKCDGIWTVRRNGKRNYCWRNCVRRCMSKNGFKRKRKKSKKRKRNKKKDKSQKRKKRCRKHKYRKNRRKTNRKGKGRGKRRGKNRRGNRFRKRKNRQRNQKS